MSLSSFTLPFIAMFLFSFYARVTAEEVSFYARFNGGYHRKSEYALRREPNIRIVGELSRFTSEVWFERVPVGSYRFTVTDPLGNCCADVALEVTKADHLLVTDVICQEAGRTFTVDFDLPPSIREIATTDLGPRVRMRRIANDALLPYFSVLVDLDVSSPLPTADLYAVGPGTFLLSVETKNGTVLGAIIVPITKRNLDEHKCVIKLGYEFEKPK